MEKTLSLVQSAFESKFPELVSKYTITQEDDEYGTCWNIETDGFENPNYDDELSEMARYFETVGFTVLDSYEHHGNRSIRIE